MTVPIHAALPLAELVAKMRLTTERPPERYESIALNVDRSAEERIEILLRRARRMGRTIIDRGGFRG